MRVLVVDQDSTLLAAITRTLGEYFRIDAVTSKADCLDLLRVNTFEVIVAGERLADGSGLELLGSLGRSHPDMLRIFSAERERLKLLRGRLGPFALFRTLTYPIDPRQLLAALAAAGGIEEEVEETAEAAVAAAPPMSARRGAVTQARAQTPAPAITQPRPPAAAKSRGKKPASPPQAAAKSPARKVRAGSGPGGTPPGASAFAPPPQPTPPAQPKLDIVARAKGYIPPDEPSPARSAFLVGAGVLVIVSALFLAFKLYSLNDEPITPRAAGNPVRTPHFPPEVVKLISDTEAAFQQDDLKTARTDVAALQQIAPDHPRLPFFVSLLERREEGALESKAALASQERPFSRHPTTPRPEPESVSRMAGRDRDALASTKVTRPTPVATRSASRAKPGSSAAPAAASKSHVATFSGKTLEDTSSAGSSQPQGLAPQSLARPGSTAAAVLEPRVVQQVAAEYPSDAARKGTEGSVDVSFSVSTDGKVSDVAVVHAEPAEVFNRAAVTAVKHWKYQPKTINGVPVEAHVQVRLQFRLDSHH